jgi:hypothetical protein
MTIKGMPIGEFLAVLVPALTMVFVWVRAKSSDRAVWLLLPLTCFVGVSIAFAYNQLAPLLAEGSYEPARTIFIALFMGAASPYLGFKYRTKLREQAEFKAKSTHEGEHP